MCFAVAGIVVLRTKIVEYFAVRAAWVTNWCLVETTATTPPVFAVIVKENSLAWLNTTLVTSFLAANFGNFRLDTFFGKDFLPNSRCFVIAWNPMRFIANKRRHVDFVRVESDHIRQKLKKPANLLFLEVIAHAPVTKHLKKRRVAVITNIFNILGTQASLAIGQANPLRVRLAKQVWQQRLHTTTSK